MQGAGVATLSPNRPEVLFAMGANQVTGAAPQRLHPLGSLDDHAYVIEDAEVEYLLFDPSFAERADGSRERVPELRTVLAFGPTVVASTSWRLACGFTAGKLTMPAARPGRPVGARLHRRDRPASRRA